jgi:hypothetical protein
MLQLAITMSGLVAWVGTWTGAMCLIAGPRAPHQTD